MADITGTAGNDKLVGTDGNDVIAGLDGNDTLSGGAGDFRHHENGKADLIAGGHILPVQDGSNTLVEFDPDGAGGAPPVILATVLDATVTGHAVLH